MTDLQIKLEIAYILGSRDKEFTGAFLEQGKELLVEEFELLVDDVASSFNKWQEDKDCSLLELLHEYLKDINLDALVAKWGR